MILFGISTKRALDVCRLTGQSFWLFYGLIYVLIFLTLSELMVNLDGLMQANMSGGEQGLLNPCEPTTLFISTHLRETARRALNTLLHLQLTGSLILTTVAGGGG